MTRLRMGYLLALACLLVAGCGGSTLGAAATATSTRTPLPTVTPSPSPTATATQPPSAACATTLAGQPGVVRHGDLLITFTFGLSYPARKLPDGLALKPYQFTTQPPMDPAVNPNIGDPVGGFDVQICNGGGVSHTLNDLGVAIQSFTAYTGALNTWNVCSTTYTRQSGATGGGCGGGVGDPNCLLVSFPSSATTGASASAATTGCTTQKLPAILAPQDAYFANLGVTMPTAAGTYTLALVYAADGVAPVSVPFADPILIAPVAHDWDGTACTTAAMQTQIPSSNPTTPYICPKS